MYSLILQYSRSLYAGEPKHFLSLLVLKRNERYNEFWSLKFAAVDFTKLFLT